MAKETVSNVPHRCHIHKCTLAIPKKLFACTNHWRTLPVQMQRSLRNAYVEGQEKTGTPSPAYLMAAHRAILWTCKREWPNDYLKLKRKYDHIDRLLTIKDAKTKQSADPQSTDSGPQLDAVNC